MESLDEATPRPQVLLVHDHIGVAGQWLNHLHTRQSDLHLLSISTMPGPPACRRETAVALAANIAHRTGALVVVLGDFGKEDERAAHRLMLCHHGISVTLVETEADLQTVMAQQQPTPSVTSAAESFAVLLRHGQATYTSSGFPSDDELRLDSSGRAQALVAAMALRAYAPTRIYCSTLLRARQTAATVAEHLGLTPPIQDVRLNEREFPPLHGLTDQQIGQRYGEEFLRAFTTSPDAVSLHGVQDLPECQARVVQFFTDLAASRTRRPLVVAHGGPFAWLASHIMGQPLIQSRRWHMRNTGMSTVTIAPELRMMSWNASSVDPAALP